MGTTTANISLYIPSAGETNYDASFMQGMINLDQHDHSGPPFNGVPLSSPGLAPGSVTYKQLNADVVQTSPSTGIGTNPSMSNQLILQGILPSIFNMGNAWPAGLATFNGSTAGTVVLTGTTNQINVANGNGSGNPTFALSSTVVFPGSIAFGTGSPNQQLSAYKSSTFIPVLNVGAQMGWTIIPTGKYWQIGAVVYYCMNFRIGLTPGSPDGTQVTINFGVTNGPPAAANDAFENSCSFHTTNLGATSGPPAATYPAGFVVPNTQTITLSTERFNGGTVLLDNTRLNSSTVFSVSGFYWIA